MWGQAAAEPLCLTRALIGQRHAIGHCHVFIGATWSDVANPACCDRITFSSYGGAGTNRNLAKAHSLDILPCHYSQIPGLIRTGDLRVDVLFLQVAPPDGQGRYSLSLAHDYLLPAIDAARIVIAEINEQAPWTFGERYLTAEEIDYAVPASYTPCEPGIAVPSSVDRAVARHVAGLVEDGATLQCGIGSLPRAVLAELMDHRDLGLHSGALIDEAARLAKAGVINNSRKTIDPGLSIVGVCMGGREAREFLDRNPAVNLRSVDYTHSATVLADVDRFVAINSAVEVDLTGQVNSEVAGGTYVGAVGGASDFLRAAQNSRRGMPIIAMPSTAGTSESRVSRIVSHLSGPVSTARSDVRFVVTEHGVADLRGASLSQRVERMLAVAAPEFREQLKHEARSLA